MRVAAVSLNRGEVRRAARAEAGYRPGWDLAGTVERAAADGSGPAEGSRVVGMLTSGAWAEAVAVPTNALAELPDGVSFEEAATLPIAGLTALYALEEGGDLLGRSVLVTGASGGAGDFALQLARLAGARVVALVRRSGARRAGQGGRGRRGRRWGGRVARCRYGPYHLILESVGGEVLGNVLSMLDKGGTCVSFGVSGGPETALDVPTFFLTGAAKLYGFIIFHEIQARPASDGLDRLARLVAQGRLKPRIEVEAPWTEIGDVASRLIDRSFTGKAVLRVI